MQTVEQLVRLFIPIIYILVLIFLFFKWFSTNDTTYMFMIMCLFFGALAGANSYD